jgi:hypothetical protein
MSNWIEILHSNNSKAIKSIFGENIPFLENAELIDFDFDFDLYCNNATLYLDLKEFPSEPPKKWGFRKYNSVQLYLKFYQISDFHLNGIIYDKDLSLSLRKEDDMIVAKHGDNINGFKIKSQYVFLNEIRGTFIGNYKLLDSEYIKDQLRNGHLSVGKPSYKW